MSGFKDFDQDTPGNNASVGAINFSEGQLPSTVNDSNRALMSALSKGLQGSDSTVASASTTNLASVETNNVVITGTSTINSFGVANAGVQRTLYINGGGLTITHSAPSIVSPTGADIAATDGDVYEVVSKGSGDWTIKSIGIGHRVTAADMEAATSANVFVTPVQQHRHPGHPKAWARFDSAGNVDASYNISSVTDEGTGSFTVNWDTDFSSATANCVTCSYRDSAALIIRLGAVAASAGSVRIVTVNTSNTATDADFYNVIAVGDQ